MAVYFRVCDDLLHKYRRNLFRHSEKVSDLIHSLTFELCIQCLPVDADDLANVVNETVSRVVTLICHPFL